MLYQRKSLQNVFIFLLLQFLVFGVGENLSTKEEESSTKSVQLPNLPCIAYLSTKTGNLQPYGSIVSNNLIDYSFDLFLLNYNSQPEINLTDNPNSSPQYQAWSPDGKILAWMYKKDGYYGIEAFENGQKRKLISSLEYSIWRFAWSPGSDQIAFLGDTIKESKRTNLGIYILRISDKSISKIFDVEPGKKFHSLCWVKNSLLWCNSDGAVEKLDLSDSRPIGSPKIILSQENARCMDIVVAPDNNTLACIVTRQNRPGIWVFDLDGKNPHKLINGENFYESCAAWHPMDNNLLAFSSRIYGGQGCLAMYEFNTGKVTSIDLKSNYRYIEEISWSKDGRYITVECLRSETKNYSSDILLYDTENSQWINITDSKDSRNFAPVCRP